MLWDTLQDRTTAGVSPTPHSKTDWLLLMGPHSLDLTGGFSSSPSIWLVSTWTSRCVRRLTLELKMAARLLQRRADSALSRYSLSSQDRGLHAKDSGKTQQKHTYSTVTHLDPRHNFMNTNTGLTRWPDVVCHVCLHLHISTGFHKLDWPKRRKT